MHCVIAVDSIFSCLRFFVRICWRNRLAARFVHTARNNRLVLQHHDASIDDTCWRTARDCSRRCRHRVCRRWRRRRRRPQIASRRRRRKQRSPSRWRTRHRRRSRTWRRARRPARPSRPAHRRRQRRAASRRRRAPSRHSATRCAADATAPRSSSSTSRSTSSSSNNNNDRARATLSARRDVRAQTTRREEKQTTYIHQRNSEKVTFFCLLDQRSRFTQITSTTSPIYIHIQQIIDDKRT